MNVATPVWLHKLKQVSCRKSSLYSRAWHWKLKVCFFQFTWILERVCDVGELLKPHWGTAGYKTGTMGATWVGWGNELLCQDKMQMQIALKIKRSNYHSPNTSVSAYNRQFLWIYFCFVSPICCTSLLGLLGCVSFCLAKPGPKNQVNLKKVAQIFPPPFAAEIDPLPLCDSNALWPDASVHCRLTTCCSVWSGRSTVASSGLFSK